jgi:hypothetical protein
MDQMCHRHVQDHYHISHFSISDYIHAQHVDRPGGLENKFRAGSILK